MFYKLGIIKEWNGSNTRQPFNTFSKQTNSGYKITLLVKANPNKIRLTQVKPSIGNIWQNIYPFICLTIGEDSLLNGIWG